MVDEELITFLRHKVETSPYGYHKSISPYKQRLISMFKFDTDNFKEGLHHLLFETVIPVCEVCKEKNAAFRSVLDGYGVTCSQKCAGAIGGEGRKQGDPKRHLAKMFATNTERYGVKTPLERKEIKAKQEDTMLERYGCAHAFQSEVIFNRFKESNNEKYGTDYWFESEAGRKMSSENITEMHRIGFFKKYFQENYGVDGWYDTEAGLRHVLRQRNAEYLYDTIEDYLNGDRIFEVAEQLNVTDYMIYRILDQRNIIYKPVHLRSSFERELVKLVKELLPNVEIIENDRSVLNGKEIDILIPSLKMGIECNGIYWHTERYKSADYHKNKFLGCIEKGIELIQITDLDFYRDKSKWINFLKNKFSVQDRKINSNDCTLTEITIEEEKQFISENSIEKYAKSSIAVGLKHKGELVSTLSFTKIPKATILNQNCIKNDIDIDNSFSILFDYILKTYINNSETILAKSDCELSNGSIYKKAGFKFLTHKDPEFLLTDGKIKTSVDKIIKLKQMEESKVSDDEYLKNELKMFKYYDAGSYFWKYINE